MAARSVLEIKQIFASYNNPKGNANTERVMRTIKEYLVWPNDFELQPALDKQVNGERYSLSSIVDAACFTMFS